MPGFWDAHADLFGPQQTNPGQAGAELGPIAMGGGPPPPQGPPPGGYQASANFSARRLNDRRDNDPKTQYGRFLNGRADSRELQQAWVAQHPDTWEQNADGDKAQPKTGLQQRPRVADHDHGASQHPHQSPRPTRTRQA